MATRGMTTVRQSITALYEESEKSAVEGAPMLAVIDAEPPAPSDMDDMTVTNEKPSIAARFDELRRLADLEMPPSQEESLMMAVEAEAAPEMAPVLEPEIRPDPTPMAGIGTPKPGLLADEILLPSEPPAPATGHGASDLEVDDIRKLVHEAWQDETAIGLPPAETPDDMSVDAPLDDPDIESAMEDIAAAVVQSAGPPSAADLEDLRADLVAAVRAELQAVVETDLKDIVKAAVAEALKDMPAAKPAPRAKKAAAKKKAAPARPKDD